jgi:hypothetical protein
MMYAELYQYLIQYKELPVPGIGTFLLQRNPAVVDFPNKKINPPSYAVAMQQGGQLPGKSFFSWLGKTISVTDREAIFRFNDFAFDMKKQLVNGDVITWNKVGTLSKGLGGDVKFLPLVDVVTLEKSITAEKIIRQRAEHMVRVGEDEKTSAEMTEMLNQPEEKKSYWWAYALAIALAGIIFIGWYFSEHGVQLSSTANGEKAKTEEASATYRLLP